MSNRRTNPLDELEARLARPLKVALFGHRDVGKTTLLAMFYRQASTGQVPGFRPGGGQRGERRISGREDRPDRIRSAAGRLARRDRAEAPPLSRPRQVRPDRQGLPGRARHPRLGGADPRVLRRLRRRAPLSRPRGPDRAGRAAAAAAGGRNLLERCIESSADARDRPARGAPADEVRPGHRPVLERPSMPVPNGDGRRRPGAGHPGGAGRAAGRRPLRDDPARTGGTRAGRRDLRGQLVRDGGGGNRPPSELRPIGLEGPLSWLADQLEAPDRAADDRDVGARPRRPLPAGSGGSGYERRYPNSDRSYAFRARLTAKAAPTTGAMRTLAGFAGWPPAGLAGYDALGFREALAFEGSEPRRAAGRGAVGRPARVAPVAGTILPAKEGTPRSREAEWRVKAAGSPGRRRDRAGRPPSRLTPSRTSHRGSRPRSRGRARQEQVRHDPRWREVEGEAARCRQTGPRRCWPPSAASSASSRNRPGAPRPWRWSRRSGRGWTAAGSTRSGGSSRTSPAPSAAGRPLPT